MLFGDSYRCASVVVTQCVVDIPLMFSLSQDQLLINVIIEQMICDPDPGMSISLGSSAVYKGVQMFTV